MNSPTTDTQRLRELLALIKEMKESLELCSKAYEVWQSPFSDQRDFEDYLTDASASAENVIIRADTALRNAAPALIDEVDGLRIDRKNLVEEMEARDVRAEDRIKLLVAERDSLRRENEDLKAKLDAIPST